MPLKQINATVTTTAGQIFQLPSGTQYTAVQIANGHTSSIYLGATSAVTTTGANHGQVLAASANVQFWLHGGDSIWAISSVATGTGDISILYPGT